jgi:predicted DNA-binding transcriptional regulator AlpA
MPQEEAMLFDDELFFESVYPLQARMQERVDQILLAVAGRLWELGRDTAPPGTLSTQEHWQVEAMRRSPLGKHLLLIACDVERAHMQLPQAQVERTMHAVLRIVFGNPFDEGYTIPAKFHLMELGKLFHEAYAKLYSSHDLLTVKQAYQEVGAARQSIYDRIADGKLHPIYYYEDLRLLRSEIEEWKAQRTLRKKR